MNILGEGIDAIDKESLLSEIAMSEMVKVKNININSIVIGKFQPRTGEISDESLSELKGSIVEQGVLQPILVREGERGGYELIAGERRFRATRLVGLSHIPCIVKKVTPQEAFAIAIIENIQRKQLTLLEESEALLKLKEEYGFSNDETARSIGRPRTTVTNLLRLAEKLCSKGKVMLDDGSIDFGHARALLILDEDLQKKYLDILKQKKISVRALEQKIRDGGMPVPSEQSTQRGKEFDILSNIILKKYNVKPVFVKKKDGYQISMKFKSLDQALLAFNK